MVTNFLVQNQQYQRRLLLIQGILIHLQYWVKIAAIISWIVAGLSLFLLYKRNFNFLLFFTFFLRWTRNFVCLAICLFTDSNAISLDIEEISHFLVHIFHHLNLDKITNLSVLLYQMLLELYPKPNWQ